MSEYSHMHHSICKHCMCDQQLATITCTGQNLYIQTIKLPNWAEVLHIHNVNMKHLPHFTYNTNLRVLRINNAKMENLHPLSFISIPNLETIHFADNMISELPDNLFQPLHKLRILNLARNKINNVGIFENIIPNNIILDQFVLDGNILERTFMLNDNSGYGTFPLAKQLHLSNTGIIGITKDYFILSENKNSINEKWTMVPFSYQQWSILKYLDLSYNQKLKINHLALELMNNITTLKLDHSKIPNEFMKWLDTKSKAKHVSISYATLNDDEMLYENNDDINEWIYCNSNLEYLDISGLGITEIILPKHCHVKYLYAQNNRIYNFQFYNPSFKKIYLDDNNLHQFPTPEIGIVFDQLEVFSISHNHMRKISSKTFHYYPSLDYLDISSNQLYYIDDDAFPSLGLRIKFLNVSNNRLANFVHPILPSLNILDLSHNQLTSLDPELFAGLPTINRLILDHNYQIDMECKLKSKNCWLDSINLLSSLVELQLSSTSLNHFPNLSTFTNLKVLTLANNKIINIDNSLLPKCLTHLDLSNNLIHNLSTISSTKISCLNDLKISNNPLQCHCSLEKFYHILQKDDLFFDQNAYYCFNNHWQYPLSTYLDSTTSCDKANDTYNSIPSFTHVTGVLLIFILIFFGVLFMLTKVNSVITKYNIVPFTYKPVQTIDEPIDL
ncbi:Cysteine-rich flanking region, C-terminal domain and Leucine-rich repeat and Leucine-rich repeat, typical subtype-containing protein [Strongyloides ratti]|uniref:Cysteine-rich flanking region, C-terminal domain and Leucine-rich repeat and Leucine-rich repeat, typical subtype-containing protein n=1 Tax=Strongyloides ratti TaxID=34506 RepID=A0A090L271_STRRB|nr:Cysteine-rich flanking region, C-terminal domain and Leucine-rich repeat and Leucine-rich repeat, typical subtype-containing protein [Strongyloides ratti]CEF63777.1 Cysteine-rich flanking region, C-terminal domain and Leucine-rich repeat and Leucine-rich repeat, typical subtype-containing protein [Strongyloides ratti]